MLSQWVSSLPLFLLACSLRKHKESCCVYTNKIEFKQLQMFPPLRFSQDSNIKSCILCESTKLQTLVHMTSAHECVHCLILNYKPAPYTQMQLLGMISNSMNGFTSPEDLFPASGEAMSEYELLYCFRRDSDKVQNYLKILKCRIVPDHGC